MSGKVAETAIDPIDPVPGDIEIRRKSVWFAALGPIMIVGILLHLYASTRYETVNSSIIKGSWRFLIPCFLLVNVLFFWRIRKGIRAAHEPFLLIIALFFSFAPLFWGVIGVTNGVLGDSPTQKVEVVVTDAQISTGTQQTALVYFKHWSMPDVQIKKWIYGPTSKRVEVNKTRISVEVRKGYWGFEYYVKGTFHLMN